VCLAVEDQPFSDSNAAMPFPLLFYTGEYAGAGNFSNPLTP
jgi:hypothetical protein